MIHTGAFTLLISSISKVISAMTAKQYAKDRTDRTPEKRVNTAKFFRIVSVVTCMIAVTVNHLLNQHQESTMDSLMKDQNSLLGSPEMLLKITDSISGLQSTIFFSALLHLILHFLTHSLDVIERNVPRVVDLHAANSIPKKDQ